LLKYKTL